MMQAEMIFEILLKADSVFDIKDAWIFVPFQLREE